MIDSIYLTFKAYLVGEKNALVSPRHHLLSYPLQVHYPSLFFSSNELLSTADYEQLELTAHTHGI